MNSFIGISKLHTTNLAVVAPGIAEALLATAFGLAAAHPRGGDLQYVFSALHRRNIVRCYADTSVEILTLRQPRPRPAAECGASRVPWRQRGGVRPMSISLNARRRRPRRDRTTST